MPWLPGATLFVEVGVPLATGLHQVDNPAIDASGRVYVTYSGSRGQQSPVSIFRVASPAVRASRSSPASSTPRRWRSGPMAGSMCRADSTARSTASSRTARTKWWRPISVWPAGWRLRPTARCSSAIARARSFTSIRRAYRDACDAAGERCRVSPRHGARRLPLCHGPDAGTYDRVYRVVDGGTCRDRSTRASAVRKAWPLTAHGVLHVVEALAGASGRVPAPQPPARRSHRRPTAGRPRLRHGRHARRQQSATRSTGSDKLRFAQARRTVDAATDAATTTSCLCLRASRSRSLSRRRVVTVARNGCWVPAIWSCWRSAR